MSLFDKALMVATLSAALSLNATNDGRAACVQWPINGSCYEPVLAPGVSWTSAQTACVARGGHLATITSAEEDAFVLSLFEGNSSFWFVDTFNNGLGPWIGGYQPPGSPEPAGNWQWVTGEPWSYVGWASGQPDNAFGGQDRLAFFRWGSTGEVGWGDTELNNPSFHRRGYICETEGPVPVETSTWGMVKTLYR